MSSLEKSFSIILLYEQMPPSLPAAQGLKDKGVEVKVVDSAAQLIKNIVSGTYDVVGLSVNHASATSLIKIINSKTNMPIMVYGEDRNDQTMKKVQLAQADFKVNGTLTAYNAWMKIHSLYKDKMTDSSEFSMNVSEDSSGSNGPVVSKGPIHIKGSSKNMMSAQKEDSSSLVTSFSKNSSENDENKRSTHAGSGDAPKKSFQRKSHHRRKKKKGSRLMSRAKPVKRAEPKPESEETTTAVPLEAKENKSSVSQKPSAKKKESDPNQTGAIMQEAFMDPSQTLDEKPIIENEEKQAGSLGSVSTIEKKNSSKGESFEEKEDFKPIKKKKAPLIRDLGPFKKAVDQAGAQAFPNRPTEFGALITSQVTVVPVQGEEHMGYFLFCSEKRSTVTDLHVDRFKEKFCKTEDFDFDQKDFGETFNIDIMENDIYQWAQVFSPFHFLFQTANKENILVCFLTKDQVYPRVSKEKENGLYEISIHDIPPFFPVNFSAFLYLKKNNKMIPYLGKGGSLSKSQVDRLSGKGYHSLFIKEEDLKAYNNFFVSQSVSKEMKPKAS